MRKTRNYRILKNLIPFLTIFLFNLAISLLFANVHGYLRVNDGYFNYAVFFRNKLFNIDESYMVVTQSDITVRPNSFRILYPFLLGLISGLFSLSIDISHLILSLITNAFLFYFLYMILNNRLSNVNNEEQSRKIYYFAIITTIPAYSIFSYKFGIDNFFSFLLLLSIWFYFKYRESLKLFYLFLSGFFSFLSLITKELAIILLLFYAYFSLETLIPSRKIRLVSITAISIISCFILINLISIAYAKYYYWLQLFYKAYHPNNAGFAYQVSLFSLGLHQLLFRWLFSFRVLPGLVLSIVFNFFPLIISKFLELFISLIPIFKEEKVSESKTLSEIISRQINSFRTLIRENRFVEVIFIFIYFYFGLLYVTQAPYLSERYFLPFSLLVTLAYFTEKKETKPKKWYNLLLFTVILGNVCFTLFRLFLLS